MLWGHKNPQIKSCWGPGVTTNGQQGENSGFIGGHNLIYSGGTVGALFFLKGGATCCSAGNIYRVNRPGKKRRGFLDKK